MKSSKIIAGLDLGTEKFKLLVGEKISDREKIKILGQFEKPSAGMRRGCVVNKDEASNRLRELIELSQKFLSRKINSVFLNIGGSHISCLNSQGSIAVSRADGRISQKDIERVISASQSVKLPPNREILDFSPQEFIIDGEKGIKDPEGMEGIKLEVRTLLILGFSPYIKNLKEAVLNAGLEIEDIKVSPVASSRAVLNKQQKELGVALLDIGAGTTGMAVFEEGSLIHVSIFPVGSSHITNDIAIGLKCSTALAERIKKEYGSRLFKEKRKKKGKISFSEEGESVTFSQKLLEKIVQIRILEIFEQVNKELKKISRQSLLPAGVIITGGGAKFPGIVDIAKKELKLPARIGVPRSFSNFNEDPCWSVASGLVLEGFDLSSEGKISFSSKSFLEWLEEKIKKIFRLITP